MSVLLSVALAATQPLPFIDRAALRTLAKFEAARDANKAARKPAPRNRLSELCAAAAVSPTPPSDPWRAYAMSAPKVSILRETCERHLASKTDANVRKLGSRTVANRPIVRAGGTPPLRAR